MKNKFITLLYIVLFAQTYTMTAKNDSTSVVKNGLGISVAPMLSMPYYVNQNNYTSNATKGRIGFAAALCQNIVLSKKQNFYLYAELGYLGTAYTTTNTYSLVYAGNSNTVSYKFLQTLNNGYFSLSLQKVLFHVSKKFGVFIGIGAQVNYLYSVSETQEQITNTNGQTITSTKTNTSTNIPSQNQFAAAAVARVGFLINPVKHLGINIAPVFNYGLNPNIVFSNNNDRFNNLGLNLQIMYNF